jgi:hypothetical protein
VTGGTSGIRAGIVDEHFVTWQGSAIGNQGDHAYGFYSGNHCGPWRTQTLFSKPPTFESGDVLELTLCLSGSTRTLAARNVTKSSAAVVVCNALPAGRTFFPAAAVYQTRGNSVELLGAS